MYHEIERKFLVDRMPALGGIKPVVQERYFLQHGDLVEERIQKSGTRYEYEMKFAISPDVWRREKRLLDYEQFSLLRKKTLKAIERVSYSLSKKNPRVSIKKYQGIYKGFVIAEVEFDSLQESKEFKPFAWMGAEITHSPLGREAWLLKFDREHFLKALSLEKSKLDIENIANGL